MRVLHVISGDLWAGAEVQAFYLLEALKRQTGTDLHAVLMNEGQLATHLRTIGIVVDVLPERQMSAKQILSGLRRLLYQVRPDVIHSHRFKENILSSIANASTIRAACVRTVHGAEETTSRGWRHIKSNMLRSLDRFCQIHLQDSTIAVSNGLGESLRASLPRQLHDSVVVIENGIDVDRVRCEAASSTVRTSSEVRIGIVGRLVPVKRVDLFLDAAALLQQRSPQVNWSFNIFGDGPLRDTLQEHARALQIERQTKFHGHRTDIIACIASLDMLVMPSDHEGLPMTLLESVAVGTPIVAHGVGGISNVLKACSGGILVTKHDAMSYADSILEMLKRPKDQVRLALQARADMYSSERSARETLALYRRLLPA